MLQPDELIVGSGDGNVCIVKDQTLKPSLFKKPTHDGVPKQITEPTKPCLVEVKNSNMLVGSASLSIATTDTWLKGGVCMLPWHAIPFLKGLGMPNANPCQNV